MRVHVFGGFGAKTSVAKAIAQSAMAFATLVLGGFWRGLSASDGDIFGHFWRSSFPDRRLTASILESILSSLKFV